jgi:adenylate cyclase
MKNKFWLLQVPLIVVFTIAFWVTTWGEEGHLNNAFVREMVFPPLRRLTLLVTDIKFALRGPQPPKNKIVIVEIDGPALEQVGRWPWHRDATALLIHKTFQAGAKAVGLDIFFTEPDKRVPDQLAEILKAQNLGAIVDQFETDRALTEVVKNYKSNLVLGWASEAVCQPKYSSETDCPVANPDAIATHPKGYKKFGFQRFDLGAAFDPKRTPIHSFATLLANIPDYTDNGEHAGYVNSVKDPDGVIRRTVLAAFADKQPYPSLAMEMARIGLNEELNLELDEDHKVKKLSFVKSGREIPTTPLGIMEINFRGPAHTFTYVSAMDIMSEEDTLKDELNRKLAGASKKEILKDAYVFIGLTAVGSHDILAFPFDSFTPGVEGHAHILDNILSGDPLLSGSRVHAGIWVTLLMIIGAAIFGFFMQKLEAVPALILFTLTLGGIGIADIKLLFGNNININSSFLILELAAIFVFTLAAKYVLEERNKKFIKSAFSKYVSPAIVDSILKDPTKLSLGGEKRELTILFSDIRSFTTFSEKMDAKALAGFLNDYLGTMTKIVFDHMGTLDKYIGDAVMAFWGAPLDQPDHAINACNAAMKMMQALGEQRARYKEVYGIDVDIGVGLNSGVVNVGNLGSADNFEYTVIGDHVNLASRLEGLTKSYGVSIVTSRFTFDIIEKLGKPLPRHRCLDLVKVKGKKKAIELIQLLAVDMNPEGLKLFQDGRTLYTAQKWDEATACFEKANELLRSSPQTEDGPSMEYIQRCKDFKANPPASDWDGSWEMHSK